ncbi:cupredoxin domain-containing protein [Numidum massiliense]|uniref:cupredoxin domain-containing protein n=1 Tax=Numidum massiliense TaxID=1522315 RepID=UPI0006D5A18C|nr:cupredoxin domain-containing protein [Numidum massiliense]
MKSTSRQWLILSLVTGLLVIGATVIVAGNALNWTSAKTTSQNDPSQVTKTFHIVTGEFKTKTADGQERDVYRFSPGHLTVLKGDRVTLNIHGINGHAHHFKIKEFGVSGTVKRGEVATVTFDADQAGTFELVCTNHRAAEDGGPMIAYITVLDQ